MPMPSHEDLRARLVRVGAENRRLSEALTAAEAANERLARENRELRRRCKLQVHPTGSLSIAADEDAHDRAHPPSKVVNYDSSFAEVRSRPEQVMGLLRAHGPMHGSAIAKALGIDRSYVSSIASSLRTQGRLVSRRQGRAVLLEAVK